MTQAGFLECVAMLALCAQVSAALLANSILGAKSIQQSNPFASCPGTPQRNTLTVDLSLQGEADLAGTDASAITISGLSGADVSGHSVLVSEPTACSRESCICPPRGSKCFWLLDDATSWEAADKACSASGGSLASFGDELEQGSVNNFVRDLQVWIGLSKDIGSDAWTWSDGSSVAFTHWQSGHPNVPSSERSCAALVMGAWVAQKCSQQHPKVCSRAADAPSSTFCAGSVRGRGLWDEGTLILALCKNASIQVGQQLTLHFNVANPPHAQPSPDVSISVSGSANMDPTPMDKPGFAVSAAGIAGAADPLVVINLCKPCPKGSFVDGLQGCRACDPGTWADQVNASTCYACPSGANSSAGSTSAQDCVCAHGRVTDDRTRCAFCNLSTALTGEHGEVSDGSGADDYIGGTFCTWTVASSAWRVALKFDFLDLVQNLDWLVVSACSDSACTAPSPLATFTGPLLPPPRLRGSWALPWPPFPPPGPQPPSPPPGPPSPLPGQPIGAVESGTGVLQIAFRTSLEGSSLPNATRGGFRAHWFTPPPHFSAAQLYRIDPTHSCQPPTDRRRGADSPALPAARSLHRRTRAVRLNASAAVLAVKIQLESPVALTYPGVVTIANLGSVGQLQSGRPKLRVELADGSSGLCSAIPGSLQVGGKCLWKVAELRGNGMAWAEAEARCRESAEGGHLASIESVAENEAVLWLVGSGGGAQFAWIGLQLRGDGPGPFAWSDNASTAFANWFPANSTLLPPDRFPQMGRCASVWAEPVADARWHRTRCEQPLPSGVCAASMSPSATRSGVFCSGAQTDVGEWDQGTLRLRLCRGQALRPGQAVIISTNVSYPAAGRGGGLGTAPRANVSISAAGSVNVSATPMEPLREVLGCVACTPGLFRRFGGPCHALCPAETAADPELVSVYCQSCPAGSTIPGEAGPGAQGSDEACECIGGHFRDRGPASECRLCPAGSYCPLGGARTPCPGNLTTVLPGAYDPVQCTCPAAFARVGQPGAPGDASACVRCPANSACPGGGLSQPCPPPATSVPGTVFVEDCKFCEPMTVEEGAAGSLSSAVAQVARNLSCAWIIRPPGASRVVLTVQSLAFRNTDGSADATGGMFAEVSACLDPRCGRTRLLQRFDRQQQPAAQFEAVSLNASTGVLQVVFGHEAALFPNFSTPQPFPQLVQGMGQLSASWFAEPSLALGSISQSNPFASCPGNSSLLQSNLLSLRLSIRSSVPLGPGSAITVSGLRGAVKPAGGAGGVPVEVARGGGGCAQEGGVSVAGSDKCLKLFFDDAPLPFADAAQRCGQWGGASLACVDDEAQDAFLAEEVARDAGPRGMTLWAWIGMHGSASDGSCESAYAKWRGGLQPPGTPYRDFCPSLGQDGFFEAMDCHRAAPWICAKRVQPRRQLEAPFCVGGSAGWGAWDHRRGDAALTLTVCEGARILGYETYDIAFTVLNPSADQASPPISVAIRGSFEIQPTALDRPGGDPASADGTRALEIVGGDKWARCEFPDEHAKRSHGGHVALAITLVLFAALLLVAVVLGWAPARAFVSSKTGVRLPEVQWPEMMRPSEIGARLSGLASMRNRARPQSDASSWYHRFTGKASEAQEFETLS